MPESAFNALCLSREKRLSPWLLPAQLRHLQAFGHTAQALRSRHSRLLARHMALGQTSWREALDRDGDGRPFFRPSHSPASFAYAGDSVFCLSAAADESGGIAIDAELINELPAMHIKDFLSKLYPSRRSRARICGALPPAALWTAFESAYKLIGSKVLQLDLPASFPLDFTASETQGFYLPRGGMHFRFLTYESSLITIASREILPADLSCKRLAKLSPPVPPPCSEAFTNNA